MKTVITITTKPGHEVKIQVEQFDDQKRTSSSGSPVKIEPFINTRFNSNNPNGSPKPYWMIHGVKYASIRKASKALKMSVGWIHHQMNTGAEGFKKVQE